MPAGPHDHLSNAKYFGSAEATFRARPDDHAGDVAAAYLQHSLVLALRQAGETATSLGERLGLGPGHLGKILSGSRPLLMRDLLALSIVLPECVQGVLTSHVVEPLPEPHRTLARRRPGGRMPEFSGGRTINWSAIQTRVISQLAQMLDADIGRFMEHSVFRHVVVTAMVGAGVLASEIFLDDEPDGGVRFDVTIGITDQTVVNCVCVTTPPIGSSGVASAVRQVVDQLSVGGAQPDKNYSVLAYLPTAVATSLLRILVPAPEFAGLRLDAEGAATVGAEIPWDLRVEVESADVGEHQLIRLSPSKEPRAGSGPVEVR